MSDYGSLFRQPQKPSSTTVVATNISLFERWKLGAVQLLDRIGAHDDPAFLLVVSARQYDDRTSSMQPVELVMVSDDRMLGHLIDLADKFHEQRFEDDGEEGEDEL